LRDFAFERLALRPQNKLLRCEHAIERRANFSADRGPFGAQIEQGDRGIRGGSL
jgi:hypothetical protein